jgi:hypothetical protein
VKPINLVRHIDGGTSPSTASDAKPNFDNCIFSFIEIAQMDS